MSFINKMKSFWSRLENIVCTNYACLCCRREIAKETEFSICEDCMKKLDKINGNLCKQCGEMIPDGNNYCDNCKTLKFEFDLSRSFARYSETASKIVKRFKYSSKKYYAEHIAELMETNKDYFVGVDYLAFVPIGEKRRKERGFNQAEEIARVLGRILNIPVIDILKKVGSERHQAGLTKKERQANLSGSIVLNSDENVNLKDKVVMIIDDVFTTGSTLSECARVLKKDKRNKPSKILCYTFAKTEFYSANNG